MEPDQGQLTQLIDHGAQLQRQVDQLAVETLTLALGLVALTIACAVMAWQLWRQ